MGKWRKRVEASACRRYPIFNNVWLWPFVWGRSTTWDFWNSYSDTCDISWHDHTAKLSAMVSHQRYFLKALGSPEDYVNCVRDCEKFYSVFEEARASILSRAKSRVFELSTIFLSIRNVATCFSLGTGAKPDFSRHSAHHLGTNSIRLPSNVYSVLERARILSTRGKGENIT